MQKKKNQKKATNSVEMRQKSMLRILVISFSILIILSMVLTSVAKF